MSCGDPKLLLEQNHPFFNLPYIYVECGTVVTSMECFNIHMHETFKYDKCFKRSIKATMCILPMHYTAITLRMSYWAARQWCQARGIAVYAPQSIIIRPNKTCKVAAHQPVLLRAACLFLLPCARSTKHCGPSCLMSTVHY